MSILSNKGPESAAPATTGIYLQEKFHCQGLLQR